MKAIYSETSHEIVINKSRFIAHVKYVTTVTAANDFIARINDEYSDARHNCYAYIVGPNMKVSDDGEPSGTAGLPMLDVLKHHQLDNIVVVTTRYFGGIKLGAGGLTRAYAKSVSSLIDNANVIELVAGLKIELIMTHSDINRVDYLINSMNINDVEKKYAMKVVYEFYIKKSDLNKLNTSILDINHLIKINVFDENFLVFA
jgi:uncharacterized YigZ family protein